MSEDKEIQMERGNTDESLTRERDKTDQALAIRRQRTQAMADSVLERAREQADGILDAAREKADEKLEVGGPVADDHAAIEIERTEEDEALKHERSAADDKVQWERDHQSRALAALLPLEREKTDRYLLTERSRSDEAVAHRDDFMGMVSHDLRDLLSGIAMIAAVEGAQAAVSADGMRTRVRMDSIARYVARMNRMIGDLVDVTSIDSGKLAVCIEPEDAAELVSEVIIPFIDTVVEKGIILESTSAGQVLPARFDKDRMLQVLTNLIVNAIRYTPVGGRITVDASQAGSELHLSVLDSGEGIRENMREAVFERFQQVDGSDHGGLGLGLHISRCLVEAQGGRIRAESNPAGSGTAFRITLPIG